MNWLAHVFLSEENVDFQIGNFLADPMKGKLCSRTYRYFGRRFFDFFSRTLQVYKRAFRLYKYLSLEDINLI